MTILIALSIAVWIFALYVSYHLIKVGLQNRKKKRELVYCPECGGCGEDGCCSALNCKQSKNGLYCETYLKDLQFGYLMFQDLYNLTYIDEKYKEAIDKLFDKHYDKIYRNK